jgi:hypothetical protein
MLSLLLTSFEAAVPGMEHTGSNVGLGVVVARPVSSS